LKFLNIKLGSLWQQLLRYRANAGENNPLAPFIKGDFLKSPLEKGDSGGCPVAMIQTLKFLYMNIDNNP